MVEKKRRTEEIVRDKEVPDKTVPYSKIFQDKTVPYTIVPRKQAKQSQSKLSTKYRVHQLCTPINNETT